MREDSFSLSKELTTLLDIFKKYKKDEAETVIVALCNKLSKDKIIDLKEIRERI